MRFKFWGVRGSVPTPVKENIRYGGNTTCIEVRGDENQLIILDGGTGIFQLAQTLGTEYPLSTHVFITHTHWDHIQGLPMFTPLFVPGNEVTFYGARDMVEDRGVRDVLSRQMEYAYFPVSEHQFLAKVEYVDLQPPYQQLDVAGMRVECLLMNHPVLNFGYRLECNGKSLVFTGDHEWDFNLYEPEDAEYAGFQEIVDEKRAAIIDFFRGADALIIDTAYTDEEYPARRGWGHGTYDFSIRAAREAGVKAAYLTHHEPTRSDDSLERVFNQALERNGVDDDGPRFILAQEGQYIEL